MYDFIAVSGNNIFLADLWKNKIVKVKYEEN